MTVADFQAGRANLTFNSTFNVTEEQLDDYGLSIYMYPGRYLAHEGDRGLATVAEEAFLVMNQIWLRFVADPGSSVQPAFTA